MSRRARTSTHADFSARPEETHRKAVCGANSAGTFYLHQLYRPGQSLHCSTHAERRARNLGLATWVFAVGIVLDVRVYAIAIRVTGRPGKRQFGYCRRILSVVCSYGCDRDRAGFCYFVSGSLSTGRGRVRCLSVLFQDHRAPYPRTKSIAASPIL